MEASIRGGETSIPFHPRTEDEGKKKHRRVKEKGGLYFFFAIPRRLFHILIKPERGEGQRRAGN